MHEIRGIPRPKKNPRSTINYDLDDGCERRDPAPLTRAERVKYDPAAPISSVECVIECIRASGQKSIVNWYWIQFTNKLFAEYILTTEHRPYLFTPGNYYFSTMMQHQPKQETTMMTQPRHSDT